MNEYTLKKKTAFILILILISFFTSLLLCEIYIRVFKEYITPEIQRKSSPQYEPSFFARHVFAQKEKRIKWWNNAEIFINKKGYRGHDFTMRKTDGTIRIIFFGGSSTFDIFQSNEKDWPHRIENILKNKGITNVEVINAGAPGYTSIDSFGKLFTECHIFEPDYVIIYNAWNDLKYFTTKVPLLRKYKTNLKAGRSKFNDPRIDYQGTIDKILCESSQFYVRLRSRYYKWKFNIGREGATPKGEYSNEISELGLKQYRLNIEMFVDLARNIGAVPILMTQARLVTRKNTEKEKALCEYKYVKMNHQTTCDAFEKADEIIKDVANSKNVLLIDASKILTGKVEFFADGVHLNNSGSHNLAAITAKYLSNLLKENYKEYF